MACQPHRHVPAGRLDGDNGLTGRKIIADTYGGGASSGKNAIKVDRSAAYAARYLAKNVVAAGLADACTIQLSYAIGVCEPLSIYVSTDGSGKVGESRLETALRESLSLTLRGIREYFELNRPIHARTAAYGHFGRAPDADGGFAWERIDLAGVAAGAFLLNRFPIPLDWRRFSISALAGLVRQSGIRLGEKTLSRCQ